MLPNTSGRYAAIRSAGICPMTSFARAASVTWPCMPWTKPAWSGSPGSSTVTSSLSWKLTSPSNSRLVSSHHRPCSGRRPLRSAASADSKRPTAMKVPSSVIPPVLPSQPIEPGRRSWSHRSIAARTPSASDVLPWMTCANMAPPTERLRPPWQSDATTGGAVRRRFCARRASGRRFTGAEEDVLAAELVHQTDGGQPFAAELDQPVPAQPVAPVAERRAQFGEQRAQLHGPGQDLDEEGRSPLPQVVPHGAEQDVLLPLDIHLDQVHSVEEPPDVDGRDVEDGDDVARHVLRQLRVRGQEGDGRGGRLVGRDVQRGRRDGGIGDGGGLDHLHGGDAVEDEVPPEDSGRERVRLHGDVADAGGGAGTLHREVADVSAELQDRARVPAVRPPPRQQLGLPALLAGPVELLDHLGVDG